MIFNCLNCGISISTKQEKCAYCKINNNETIEMLTGRTAFSLDKGKSDWKEKTKGTILSYVLR